MKCLECKELIRALDAASADFNHAINSSFYLVSTEIAARAQVDMERAKTAFSEHAAACSSIETVSDFQTSVVSV
jgi:hypothetical protein